MQIAVLWNTYFKYNIKVVNNLSIVSNDDNKNYFRPKNVSGIFYQI